MLRKAILSFALTLLSFSAFACPTCANFTSVNATVTGYANGRTSSVVTGFADVRGQTFALNGTTLFHLQGTFGAQSIYGGVSGTSVVAFNEVRVPSVCSIGCGLDLVQNSGVVYSVASAYDPVTMTTAAMDIRGVHLAPGGVVEFQLGGNAAALGTYYATSSMGGQYESLIHGYGWVPAF